MSRGYRQVLVDGSPVGLRGLDEVFTDLREQGRTPQDEGLGAEIVKRMSEDNYIPYGARDLFAAAFVREYAAYLARGDSGEGRRGGYGTWRGYPREQIPWYPTVNEDLCNGCGACLKLCSAGALVEIEAETDDGKVRVSDPFACVVGCSSCATLCKPGAITFPPRTMLEAYQYKSLRR
ncbi:MAG: indolepyruvate ferredoxin oxidoreductase subunit alpha [Anaerolineae bacterium]